MSKLTGLPSGEGVFNTGKWLYFGKVHDGKCFVGEILCINRESKHGEYWIMNAKCSPSGALYEKV